MALLMYIIYKTEAIYWFNGTEYKEALEAGSQRRKRFAYRHMIYFGGFAFVHILLSLLLHMLHMSYWIDIVTGCIGLIITAISTIKIKL